MNDKEILMEKDAEQGVETRAPRSRIPGTILAIVLCLLLALIVWVGVMNMQDTDYIPVRIEGPEGYVCELSVDGVEVEGKVSTLRNMNEITIVLSKMEVEQIVFGFGGSAGVNEAFLRLPEGVSVTRSWSAVITVRAK